jgi:pimeloyl-ACP methyl ester carboxylesterase
MDSHWTIRIGRTFTGRNALVLALMVFPGASLGATGVPAAQGQASPARAGESEEVVFTSKRNGSSQRYVVVKPEGLRVSEPVSVMIALHGHGSDRWQFVRAARDECRAARDAAAKRRLIFVSPDYRAATSWMGPAAEADVVQILGDLRRAFRVDKVVICGGSMGGTAALTFASLHPELVDGVVSMNGTANLVEYTGFQDAIAASFGGSKQTRPDEYRERSAELHADRLTMPVGLTAGGRDTIVPPESVLRLARRLQEMHREVRLIHRPDGGHSTTYADAAEAFEFVLSRMSGARR